MIKRANFLKLNAKRSFQSNLKLFQSQKIDIDPEIRKLLKPTVLKVLDGKDDEFLKKKINFLGFKLTTRLNTAPVLLLEQLNNENVFSIITKQLKNPWEYYWEDVKQCGSDANKWVEAMLELEKLNSPYQMGMCYLKMQGYINPPLEVFNILFRTYSNYARLHEFAFLFDDLNRCYHFARPNVDTWISFVKMFCNMKAYYFADLVLGQMKSSKHTPSPELVKEISEGLATQEKALGEIEEWMDNDNKGEVPSILKYGYDFVKTKQQEIFDTFPQTIQPPLEWLTVKEVKETDSEKTEK